MTDNGQDPGPSLDSAPCGLVSFLDDGTVTAVNQTLLDMLDIAGSNVVGRHIESILTVGSRIFYQTHLFPLLRLHGRADEIFMSLCTSDGREIGVLLNAVRRQRDGRSITDCAVLRVQERRKFEDALVRAKKEADEARALAEAQSRATQGANERLRIQTAELELQGAELQSLNDTLRERTVELERQRSLAEEASRAKSTFLTMMSHELRTPLNAIGGYTQLLEMGIHGPTTPPQLEALAKISKSQRHLLRLINEVLNLARIEAGQVLYERDLVPLRDVVETVLPMIEPQLATHHLHCDVDIPAEAVARADREKVQQIVLNLLSNASKFTPAGGRVSIDGFLDPRGRPVVYLRVRDTGIGIARARLEQVFEPFVQVDVSLTGRSEGTGLGLAISRDLARGMNGDLRARSDQGKGASFTLTLPRGRR